MRHRSVDLSRGSQPSIIIVSLLPIGSSGALDDALALCPHPEAPGGSESARSLPFAPPPGEHRNSGGSVLLQYTRARTTTRSNFSNRCREYDLIYFRVIRVHGGESLSTTSSYRFDKIEWPGHTEEEARAPLRGRIRLADREQYCSRRIPWNLQFGRENARTPHRADGTGSGPEVD